VAQSQYQQDLEKLYQDSNMTDLIFVCSGSVGLSAHKFFLASVSHLMHSILTMDLSSSVPSQNQVHTLYGSSTVRTTKQSHKLESYLATGQVLKEHTACLYKQVASLKSSPRPPRDVVTLGPGVFRQLRHPAFTSIHIQQCQTADQQGNVLSSVQTVLTCSKLLSPLAMRQVLSYLYTGRVDLAAVDLVSLKQAAEVLSLSSLTELLAKPGPGYQALSVSEGLEEGCLSTSLFSDVLFTLDDGTLGAHKAMLMARCDMMAAMFSHNFLEGSAGTVSFPGVTRKALQCVQHYLYTDKAPPVTPSTCLPVIELANRLVLPRLVNLLETTVITAMREIIEDGGEVFQAALDLVDASQVHNAPQLSEWCLAYLGQNYSTVCARYSQLSKSLAPENQALLSLNRWPPLWYVREYELYSHLSSCRPDSVQRRPRKRPNSVCLCFSSQQGQNSSYNLAGLARGDMEERGSSKRSCSSSAITQEGL
jgi:Rho-related BTB domain-containing protein 1/2